VKRFLRIGGSAALLALLAWRVELRGVTQTLAGVYWSWWLAALACYFLAQLVSAVRWQRLSRPLGFHQGLGAHLGYLFAGNFFNLLLPTSVGGDVARAWYLGRGSGQGSRAVLCVLIDRLNGLYVLVAMACGAALVVELPHWAAGFIAFSGVAGLVGLALLWLPWNRAAAGEGRWRKRWRELAEGMDFYRRSPRLLAGVTFLSLVVQLLNVLLVWCLARAVDANVSLAFCGVLMPIVTLLTLAPVSVNGVGVREFFTAVLLAPLGVPNGQAITLSILWFSVFLAAGLTGGVWFVAGRLPRCEVSADAEPVCGDPDQGREGQSASAA
jgi:uncharacterized membrane protein YbhN (UPF0104 family)